MQAGELIIGSDEKPFNRTATITLHGTATEATLVMTGALEAGNKLLANTGLISLKGAPRDRWSRLRSVVERGDRSALVEIGLDWRAGDRVYLAPTAMQFDHSDYMDIEAYNNNTGEITFTEGVQFYHWGQSSSTEDDYNGLDMRGEVVLLSRHIRILGTDEDKWGCNVINSEFLQSDGTLRSGQLIFDQVELYNCSQRNTQKAAIRFEGSITKQQYVRDCVIHEGHGWSMFISSSRNINVINSSFIGGLVFGINMLATQDSVLDNNLVADVRRRLNEGIHLIDMEGGYAICSTQDNNICKNLTITNNVAVGTVFAGFVAPGHNCGEESTQ